MKEKDLVLAARGGDRDAFSELISNYTDRIYRLAWKLSGNQEDAEDIFQETFLKAVDNIGSFRLESSFGTWLYSIAMNVMRTCFAKRKKMQLGQPRYNNCVYEKDCLSARNAEIECRTKDAGYE